MLLNEKLNFGAPLEIETYMQYVTQILVAHKSLTFNMSPSVQSWQLFLLTRLRLRLKLPVLGKWNGQLIAAIFN